VHINTSQKSFWSWGSTPRVGGFQWLSRCIFHDLPGPCTACRSTSCFYSQR